MNYNQVLCNNRAQIQSHFLKRKIKAAYEREPLEKNKGFFNVPFIPNIQMFQSPQAPTLNIMPNINQSQDKKHHTNSHYNSNNNNNNQYSSSSNNNQRPSMHKISNNNNSSIINNNNNMNSSQISTPSNNTINKNESGKPDIKSVEFHLTKQRDIFSTDKINNHQNRNPNQGSSAQTSQELLRKQIQTQELIMNRLTEKYKNDLGKLKHDPEFQELVKVNKVQLFITVCDYFNFILML